LKEPRSGEVNRDRTVWFIVSASGRTADLSWGGFEAGRDPKRSLAWVARQRIGGLQKGHSGSVECNPYNLTRNAVDISAWLRRWLERYVEAFQANAVDARSSPHLEHIPIAWNRSL
jgi:hypothetical protein